MSHLDMPSWTASKSHNMTCGIEPNTNAEKENFPSYEELIQISASQQPPQLTTPLCPLCNEPMKDPDPSNPHKPILDIRSPPWTFIKFHLRWIFKGNGIKNGFNYIALNMSLADDPAVQAQVVYGTNFDTGDSTYHKCATASLEELYRRGRESNGSKYVRVYLSATDGSFKDKVRVGLRDEIKPPKLQAWFEAIIRRKRRGTRQN